MLTPGERRHTYPIADRRLLYTVELWSEKKKEINASKIYSPVGNLAERAKLSDTAPSYSLREISSVRYPLWSTACVRRCEGVLGLCVVGYFLLGLTTIDVGVNMVELLYSNIFAQTNLTLVT